MRGHGRRTRRRRRQNLCPALLRTDWSVSGYERLVEEHIFCDVVRRGVDRIETQRLRMVHLSETLAIRFHEGMTRTNAYSHDNPASATVAVPTPDEFDVDVTFIETLIADLKTDSLAAESKRPAMNQNNRQHLARRRTWPGPLDGAVATSERSSRCRARQCRG